MTLLLWHYYYSYSVTNYFHHCNINDAFYKLDIFVLGYKSVSMYVCMCEFDVVHKNMNVAESVFYFSIAKQLLKHSYMHV